MAAVLDHDALFKLLLTAFFAEFLELFAPDLAAALDPTPLVFLDKESFSDLLDPDRREADLVVQAWLREQPATLLIHLEHCVACDARKLEPAVARKRCHIVGSQIEPDLRNARRHTPSVSTKAASAGAASPWARKPAVHPSCAATGFSTGRCVTSVESTIAVDVVP